MAEPTTPIKKLDSALEAYLAKFEFDAGDILAKNGVTGLKRLKQLAEGAHRDIRKEIEAKLDRFQLVIWKTDVLSLENIRNPNAPTTAKPDGPDAEAKRKKLSEAIAEAENLKRAAGEANAKNDAALKDQVANGFNELGARLKRDGIGQLPSVTAAGSDLAAALVSTVSLLEKFDQSLVASINRGRLSVDAMIEDLELFKGYQIRDPFQHERVVMATAGNAIRLATGVNTERLLKQGGKDETVTHSYKSQKASVSVLNQIGKWGSSWSTVNTFSASGFVGSGIGSGSVSVNAGGSREEEAQGLSEQSGVEAHALIVKRSYVRKKTLVFDTDDLRLSGAAEEAIREKILKETDDSKRRELIKEFFIDYGSHVFTRYTLGGVYVQEAAASSKDEKLKQELSNNVATAANWAVEASASYAGIGGSGRSSSAVKSSQHAESGKYSSTNVEVAGQTVDVSFSSLGGQSGLPMDMWRASLEYNPQWAVIEAKPEHTFPVWELIKRLEGISVDSVRKLVEQFRKVWQEDIYTVRLRLKRFESPPTAASAACQQSVKLDRGYKVISGGAAVIGGTDGETGHFIYESYPVKNQDGTWSWYASSHEVGGRSDGPNHYKARLVVAAIGVFDPEDNLDVHIESKPIRDKKRNQDVTVPMPSDYVLTGGGVKQTNSETAGTEKWATTAFLAASHPVISEGAPSWFVRTESHQFVDRHEIEAYAIGIRAKDGRKPGAQIESLLTDAKFDPARSAHSKHGIVIGGGAAALDRSQALYASWPSSLSEWEAKAAKKAWATGASSDSADRKREIAWPKIVALKFGESFLQCVNRYSLDDKFYQLEPGPTICNQLCLLEVAEPEHGDGIVFKGWNKKYLGDVSRSVDRETKNRMEFYKDVYDQFCILKTHSLGGNEVALETHNKTFVGITTEEKDIYKFQLGKTNIDDVYAKLKITDQAAPQTLRVWAIGSTGAEQLQG